MNVTLLPIEKIIADPRIQPRVELDALVVDDYAAAMSAGKEFPAVVVFFDGKDHWLSDGFHRYHAAIQAGSADLMTDVRPGGFRDAILHAVGANAEHGKPRTNADKRRAVLLLLGDSEWSQWSDSQIAQQAAVSNRFVANVRGELSLNGSKMASDRMVERGGTTYRMSTARIGASHKLVKEARNQLRDSLVADDPRQLQRLAKCPVEVQVRAAELIARGESKKVESALRHLRYEGNVERSLADVATGRFPVVLADPPWKYPSGDGIEGAANDQYPCMTTEEICALPVREKTAEDAVLFLWSTNAHLPDALRVLEAWGFRYVGNLAWVKNTFGLGFYFRGKHELLLLGLRGSLIPKEAVPSVLAADARGHSVKPDEVYELIERMYPGLRYLELFARRRPSRPRWVAWGNEPALEAAQAGKELGDR